MMVQVQVELSSENSLRVRLLKAKMGLTNEQAINLMLESYVVEA